VSDALERADELVALYDGIVRAELPPGAEIFDAHTHLGLDIDGRSGEPDHLTEIQERYGISGSFMFCLDEPDREPGFRAPNDRTLAHAEASNGRFVPFVRLDLTHEPIAEATRCLDLGARGIKLHPRAQGFALDDARLDGVFALAAERGVPILIHGGRGLPPIAAHLGDLVERYPEARLIVAHCGIADLAGLAGRLSGNPSVFFDISVWSPLDILDLYRLVSPGQVLYASDYPYGGQPASLLMALRTAQLVGLGDDELRDMLGRTARRLIAGEPQPALAPPKGPSSLSVPLTFARIHQYLSMATPLLWMRQPDTIGVLGLALNTCFEQDGHPQETERIKELLLGAQALWTQLPDAGDPDAAGRYARRAFQLLHLASIQTVTTDA
jgi:uncharacterized protein